MYVCSILGPNLVGLTVEDNFPNNWTLYVAESTVWVFTLPSAKNRHSLECTSKNPDLVYFTQLAKSLMQVTKSYLDECLLALH